MKKMMLALITTLAPCWGSVQAQDANSLLWRISGNGLPQPSYLFGTIHLMCPDDIRISGAVEDALQHAQQLVLELDLDEPGVMSAMQQGVMMTDGTTLSDLLSEEEYQLVEDYLQDSLQMPIQALNTMKPIILSSLTYLDVLDCQPGSYEMDLTRRAKAQNKEVLGLETVEEQINAFDFIPLGEQSDYLVRGLREYDKTSAEITSLLEAYRKEQVTQLYELTHEAMRGMEGAEKALLGDRNQKWVPQMEEMAQEQATFFAVGAGHLGGPQGLLALLRARGYTVDAVTTAIH